MPSDDAGGPAAVPGQPASSTIDREECFTLLARGHLGRVAWRAADGLQVLPVSYALHHSTLVFRTSAYGVLSELVHPSEAVLEVDELDPERFCGWSVVVRGTASAVAEPAELVSLWTVDGLIPWAPGLRTLFIQLRPERVTGRRFTRTGAPQPE